MRYGVALFQVGEALESIEGEHFWRNPYMNMKTRLLVAFATAMVAPLALTACGGGPECGEGTTLQDDKCISTVEQVDPVECAAGTKLVEGKCELDDSGCGEDTELDGGVCVSTVEEPDPAEGCGDGTSFDEGSGKCIPTSTIECGDNTIEEDGSCVPDPTKVCAAGTSANDDGVCVIAAASCGDNTILDPNENKCLVNDAGVYCSPNTAYDADTESCVPTNAVCDTGTTFSEDTGLCLPDATCATGDVLLDGVCVAPITDALAKADLAGNEEADPAANNDNPESGGTPVELTLPAMGTEYTVSGTIGAPTDLDNDGEADQDIDFYSFSATAGQTFKIAVQPEAGASLSFVVTSADGNYRRFSTLGLSAGAARKIVIPADGDYMIAVAPSFLIAAGGEGGPVGADDWNYLLTIEETAGITPADVDASMGPITGSFANLDDNLFKATNLTQGDVVNITVNDIGENVDVGFLQLWTSPTTLYRTFEDIEAGDTFQLTLPVGDVFFLFDWGLVNGANVDFDVTVESIAVPTAIGEVAAGGTASTMPATFADGDTVFLTVGAVAGEVLEFSHINDEAKALDVTLIGPNDEVILDGVSFDVVSDDEFEYVYSPMGGTYTIQVTNDSGETVNNAALTVNSLTPNDLGSAAVGGMITGAQANDVALNKKEYHKFTLTERAELVGTLTNANGDDVDLRLYDAQTGERLESFTNFSATVDIEGILPAGEYLLEVIADDLLVGGYDLSIDLVTPPAAEEEPNNDTATATLIPPVGKVLGEFVDGDVDTFQIDVATSLNPTDVWTVYVEPDRSTNTSIEYTCRLLDAAGMEFLSATSTNDCALLVPAVQMGTYFLEVTTNGITSGTDYRITSNVVPMATVETEANDDSMTATPWDITLGMFGDMGNTNTDKDWYLITIPNTVTPDAELELTMDAYEDNDFDSSRAADQLILNKDATSSVNFAIYQDPTAASLDATIGFGSYPKSISIGPGLVAGETYYVEVSRTSTSALFTGRHLMKAELQVPPPPAPGEVCSTAIPIAMSTTISGDSAGFENDYSPGSSCTGFGANGNDVVYSVTLAAGETLDASLTGTTSGFDTSLYVVSDCANVTNSCLDGSDGSGTETITYTSTAGETVFLIVDGYGSTDSGTYDLTVTLTPAP